MCAIINDHDSFILYAETWKMVCHTCSDSMANILSSTEGTARLHFLTSVVTFVVIKKKVLQS